MTWQNPHLFSDQNDFLKGFVNHELLGFMGVIVTITLVSTTNLFVELHKLEARYGKDSFKNSRKDVKDSAYAMIIFLILSLVIVVAKPIFPGTYTWQSVFNLSALTLVISSAFMLFDITQAGFNVAPLTGNNEKPDDNRSNT
ncbi:MAG: hypothetical protein ABII76_11825 [Pseudomonadota bacterium]